MNWVTRAGIHVDRAASAWLIARFVDPGATFAYVDSVDEIPGDATPFDMRVGALTHRGDDITFETILREYDLADPVLWRIARIVHQADVEDDRYDAPEAPGLDVIVRAVSAVHDDEATRHLVGTILDALYEHFRSSELA